ncbi:hypothetical protein RND71_043486 [Anisodus tanguticus]|uniref:Protein kinase domain-containing protein n=1 Tax=Anisodus tanguticus TaxID=243964 RepID=A0AAE1QPG0_9SOLA|nr:hypothetical protein RND71_043486 [Anisodus tanguticus]
MAPEVVMCETFKDHPYEYKADIWSLGITLIELAERQPPNHGLTPMRVLLRIQKSEAPTLEQPNKWSTVFRDFIKSCLVKDPNLRPSVEELKKHKFICEISEKEITSINYLLTEFQADYVEEVEVITVTDNEEDHNEDQLSQRLSVAESPVSNDEIKKVLSKKSINGNSEKIPNSAIKQKNRAPSPPKLKSSNEKTTESSNSVKDENKKLIINNLDNSNESSILTKNHKVKQSVSSDENKKLDNSDFNEHVYITSSNNSIPKKNDQETKLNDTSHVSIVTIKNDKDVSIKSSSNNSSKIKNENKTIFQIENEQKNSLLRSKSNQINKSLNEKDSDYNHRQQLPTSHPPPPPPLNKSQFLIDTKQNIVVTENNTEEIKYRNKSSPRIGNQFFENTKIDEKIPENSVLSNSKNQLIKSTKNGPIKCTKTDQANLDVNQKNVKREPSNAGSLSSVDSNQQSLTRSSNSRIIDKGMALVQLRKNKVADRTSNQHKSISINAAQKKTMKRTRKFVIDGVVVTTTTSKVIYGDEDRLRDDHVLR